MSWSILNGNSSILNRGSLNGNSSVVNWSILSSNCGILDWSSLDSNSGVLNWCSLNRNGGICWNTFKFVKSSLDSLSVLFSDSISITLVHCFNSDFVSVVFQLS